MAAPATACRGTADRLPHGVLGAGPSAAIGALLSFAASARHAVGWAGQTLGGVLQRPAVRGRLHGPADAPFGGPVGALLPRLLRASLLMWRWRNPLRGPGLRGLLRVGLLRRVGFPYIGLVVG